MKKTVWMTFDLALGGDYESLYAWLDDAEAKECGNGVAVFEFETQGNLEEELTSALTQRINFKKNDRVYAIWREGQKVRGKFLVGKRKSAPWKGYGAAVELEDVEA